MHQDVTYHSQSVPLTTIAPLKIPFDVIFTEPARFVSNVLFERKKCNVHTV